jgi:hypothetical protein
LIRNKPFKNSLIIFDSGIDRKYKELFLAASVKGYEVFKIRFIVADKILRERLKKREGNNAMAYFKEFKRWKKEFKEFGDNVESDVILKNEGKLDLKEVYGKLDVLTKHI